MNSSFWKAGHRPTLLAAFLYFDLAFMVWVMLGPLGVQIAKDLGLTHAQKGMMVATPVLAGAILRIFMGILVDHLKPKMAGAIGQVIVIASLFFAWYFGIDSYEQTLILGVFLGVAGASFAVALPLGLALVSARASGYRSRYRRCRQLGHGAGGADRAESGDGLRLGQRLRAGADSAVLVFAFYLVAARDAPECPPPKALPNTSRCSGTATRGGSCSSTAVTFGGFVGLASSLTIYFNIQYGLDAKTAGFFTAACVFAGSLVRPIGGNVADRIGGIKSLSVMYVLAAIFLGVASIGLPAAWMALLAFVGAMLALGMGNGAVFQLVPQRFRKEIGVMTGLVGMAGGVGGFYLASSLGYAKQITGSYQIGFLIFAGLALLALAGLSAVKTRWRTTWGAAHLTAARI
jgi:NNP family nitrate/nitrite transporter-like MFS transporter